MPPPGRIPRRLLPWIARVELGAPIACQAHPALTQPRAQSGILSEDVVANSDAVIRRAKSNEYSEYGLPGMREGR